CRGRPHSLGRRTDRRYPGGVAPICAGPHQASARLRCLCGCAQNGVRFLLKRHARGRTMAETTVLARTDGSRPYNNLLRHLREPDYALIAPSLFTSAHSVNDVIYNPGDHVEVVHFPCGPAMVSFVISGEDGRDVETVLIGREGAVGGIVSQGRLPAYSR